MDILDIQQSQVNFEARHFKIRGGSYRQRPGEEPEEHGEGLVYAILLLSVLMVIYVLVGTRMETKGCGFGHETGVVIIIGMVVSYILNVANEVNIGAFSPDVLFEFGLPMILYAAGYNMRRRRFFDNINNITMFGILSTVLCFIILSSLTYAIFKAGMISKYKYDEESQSWTNAVIYEPPMEIFLLCAMLCSSDIIAAVSLVKYRDYPRIFSVLLGEGLWNDAVAVVLAQSCEEMVHNHESLSFKAIGQIIGDFFILTFVSTLIGVVFGVLTGIITKYCRFLTRSSIHETFIMFLFGIISYYISDLLKMSGIISIIVTAVMQAHYSWYNLSPQGKHVSAVTFQTLGYFSEAMIFSYVGVGIFQYRHSDWSPSFIGYEFVIIIVGRLLSVILVEYSFVICGCKGTFKFKELVFLSYAGMIRGAIALGLAIRASAVFSDYDVFVTSVLSLVILTTLVFGSFMPLMAKLLLEPPKNSHHGNVPTIEVQQTMEDSILTTQRGETAVARSNRSNLKVEITEQPNEKSTKPEQDIDQHLALAMKNKRANQIVEEKPEKQLSHSEYSEFIAPNAAPSEITTPLKGSKAEPPKKLGWFKSLFVKLDMQVMKPFLVYKYTTESVEAMNEIEAMLDEQENWQEVLSNKMLDPTKRNLKVSYMNAMLMSVQEKRAEELSQTNLHAKSMFGQGYQYRSVLSKADEGKTGARRTQAVIQHESLESRTTPPAFGQERLSDAYEIGGSPDNRASSFGNQISQARSSNRGQSREITAGETTAQFNKTRDQSADYSTDQRQANGRTQIEKE